MRISICSFFCGLKLHTGKLLTFETEFQSFFLNAFEGFTGLAKMFASIFQPTSLTRLRNYAVFFDSERLFFSLCFLAQP